MNQLHPLSTPPGFLRSTKNMTLDGLWGFIHQMDEKSIGEKFSPVILRSCFFLSSHSNNFLMNDSGDDGMGSFVTDHLLLSHTLTSPRHLCNSCSNSPCNPPI
jgi:hypothetical protein